MVTPPKSIHLGRRPPPRAERARMPPQLPGEPLRARDGSPLLLRPIHADDVAALQRGFRHLAPDEIRMRFLHPLTELPEAFARKLCDLDADSAVAFVLIDPPPASAPEIHAVGRAHVDPVTLAAEFAVIVQRCYSGQGFGRLLMQRVIEGCRARGATEMWGDVFIDNGAMLALCDSLGFARHLLEHEPGLMRVTLALS